MELYICNESNRFWRWHLKEHIMLENTVNTQGDVAQKLNTDFKKSTDFGILGEKKYFSVMFTSLLFCNKLTRKKNNIKALNIFC